MVELLVDVREQFGQRISGLVAADEGVLGLRLRVAVQHGLPHRELVQVGVQQAADDGLHGAVLRCSFGQVLAVEKGTHFGAGEKPGAAVAHVLQERQVLRLEAGHRAHAVGDEHQLGRIAGGQVGGNVLRGGLHAVAAGFAGNHDQVGAVERRDQRHVEQGGGVVLVRHFGLNGAVVLGPGVAPLADLFHHAQLLVLPGVVGGLDGGMHVVAPAADLAMHRPHHQRVAAAALELVDVGQRPGQGSGVARTVVAGIDLCRGDRCERLHTGAIARLPERGVRNVEPVVRIQRNGDTRNALRPLADELGHPQHVGMGTRNRQCRLQLRARGCVCRKPAGRKVAEVVLRIDQEKLDVLLHGVFFG